MVTSGSDGSVSQLRLRSLNTAAAIGADDLEVGRR